MPVGTYLACDTDISSVLETSSQELVRKTGARGGKKLIYVTSDTEKYATVGKDLSVRKDRQEGSGSPFHDSLF